MTRKVRNFCRLGMKLASLYFFLFLFCGIGVSAEAAANRTLDRLSRHGASGSIAVRAGGKRFPGNAQVSISRTRSEDVKRRVSSGLKAKKGRKLKLGRHGAKPAQVQPAVLAMYDISISADGRKWQPDAGDPVQVTVDLAEPVSVNAGSELAVVHMADDGTVEKLDSSKYGFTYNAEKTEVTAFWFSATGFSVYAIVDAAGNLVTPRRFYHFYGHPTTVTENGQASSYTLPYIYHDESNDVVNVQIVKDGDMLKAPPIPPDITNEIGEVVNMFEGWYVVATNARPADAVESKLDSTNEYFRFVWPVGVTENRLAFTNAVQFAKDENGKLTDTADVDYYVVPLYEHARFLQFNENTEEESDGGHRIIDRKLIAINDETGWVRVKVSDVTAALVNSRQEYFCGWRFRNKNGQWEDLFVYGTDGLPLEQYITIDNELFAANGGLVIPLHPVYVSAHFLNFDTNAKGSGAKYVGSIFVRSTSEFSNVTPSGNRDGYNFTGWCVGTVENGKVVLGERFTDASGNFIPNVTATNATGAVIAYTDASGNIRLNKDVTLYAGWVANTTASYRVIVWQQRVTDDVNAAETNRTYYYATHYTSQKVSATTQISESLITSFTGTAVSGTNPNNANLTALSGTSNITGKDFTGFHYSRFTCDDDVVAADDSTVINIYYDRNVHVLTFQPVSGRVTGTHAITNLYEASIKDNFPIAGVEGIIWKDTSEKVYKYTLATLESMPDSDVTFSGEYRGSDYTIYYYVQVVGTDAYDDTFNNKHYKLHKTVKHKFNYLTYDEEFHPIAGFNRSYSNANPTFSYDRSKGGYVATIPNNHINKLYYDRINYELIYCDGDDFVYRTGETVPYGSPLTDYNLAATNSLLSWGSRDITVGTFEGWYEDASLTVKFDFNHTMPGGTKFLYAKWAPIKYKVIVDPNGGEMQTGDSTWFYLDAGEKLLEYTVTRNYRLDMHNGTYYYHHDLWDPVKDKHTDQYDPSTAGAPRRAYYTQDVADATDNEVSSPENRYSYEPKAYAFMGWYEVLADGTLANDPFSFNDPPNREVTIRAVWRRTGVYTLHYESIDPDGIQPDEVIYDPEKGVDGGYIDDAVTTMAKDPTNYNKDEWVWEGWQVVDTYNGNIPLTNIRSPGDVYVVHENHADRENVIHFRAVYKRIDDGTSRHIPPVTDLVLDSNENAGLAAGATIPQRAGSGLYTDGSSVSAGGFNQGVWFAGMQNNFSVNLEEYSDAFAHNNGYFLLGWDPMSHVDSLIPTYVPAQMIGVDKSAGGENVLYAVWEPQVYIDFVNDTGTNLTGVTLYIPSWVDGELFRVNTVTGTYGREAFTAFSDGTAEFDLAAGETLRLVLPDAADRDFAVMGTCSYTEGNKLVVTRIEPTIEGQAAIPDVTQSVYPGEEYMVSGTMKVSPTPVQVVFTKDTYQTATDVPVRYFIHDPDGTITEITTDSSKWETYNSVKKTLTGINGSTNDIALLLRKSSTAGVHEYLTTSIRGQYGYTTIGIGAATGNFDEWRTISKNEPSGGSYIRFYHEKLEWSRYAQIWNDYQDAAVYVVFYQRIPVHVTIAKNVVGTEEDKADKSFNFTATFEEHSKTIEYVVTATYRRKRSGWFSDWDNDEGNFDSASTNDYKELTAQADQSLFASSRSSESFSLNDKGRHPITVYFNRSENGVPSGNPTNWKNADTWGNNQTRTQKVKYTVTYQYETVTIQEAETNLFTLTAIDGETGHGHSGTANVVARSYTVSSKKNVTSGGFNGFATYTPLDTAIFTNTRKTGDLTISKTVVDGDAGDTFPFTVTLGETVVDKDNYMPPAGVHLGPYGKVFSFSLANGGSVTLPGLPAGASYTVQEVSHAKYVPTLPANASGAIAADTTVSVGVTNTRKSDLTVTMNDRTVIFTGDEQSGYEISEVTGTGEAIVADGYTVTGLKEGHVLTVQHYVVPRGTTVGSYTGHVENVRYTVLEPVANGDPKDVTGEYLFTATVGALAINPTPIIVTVTGNTTNVVYNGEEQSLQGYTYVITHAEKKDEVLTNDNVFVSIPVDYQSAWGKDAGTYNMNITPDNVSVIVPDGMSVSEVVVAAQGSLVIEPKPITATADDKVKILGRSDPALTATVTGLCGDDTVDYKLSRAAGEAAGTYTITAAPGDVASANYTVTYETGTFTIQELDLVQRATGEGRTVDDDVPITDDLIEALGFDSQSELDAATVADVMNQKSPNGLYRWENIVLGTDTNQVLLSTAVDASVGAVTIAISRNEGEGQMEDLGYIVLQDLRRWITNGVNSAWNRIAGPSAEKTPTFNIQMTDASGNSLNAAGYYRVFTLLVPKSDLSITNELPSTNIVGVLEVDSTLKDTMTAVPWNALAHDPADPLKITVADYMTPSQLAAGDSVIALNENGVYEKWTLKAATRGAATPKWQSSPTVVDSGDEDSVGVLSATPPADARELDRGKAVWVERENTSKPYFLVGQYNSDPVQIAITGGSVAEKGSTMITNPTLEPISVNDFEWGSNPSADDVIQVPNGLGVPLALIWRNGSWGYSDKVYDAQKKRYVKEWKTNVMIAPGTGFWYYRTGSGFTVTLNVDVVK